MFKSIRWTLQSWHAALLALALLGFGAASYFEISRARYKEIDAELEGAGNVLLAKLRRPPARLTTPPINRRPRPGNPPEFNGDGPGPGPGRPPRREDGPPGPDGGPPPRPEDQLGPDNQTSRAFVEREIEPPPGFVQRYSATTDEMPYFIVWREDGDIIKASPNTPAVIQHTKPADLVAPGRAHQRGPNRELVLVDAPGRHVLVGRSVQRDLDQLHRLVWIMSATGAGVLLVGLFGGWLVSRKAVRPIDAISATAESISASSLSGRIPVDNVPSELGKLAQVLNATFARLEGAFAQQTRFTADASHELRTPLSVIHSHAELALSRDRSASEYRQTLETCLKASGRMKGLVESLLLLARADAGGLKPEVARFNVRPVVDDCLNLVATLAKERGITIDTDLRPVDVEGDLTQVGQVITNLLTNAIRYNREGGSVRVWTGTDGKYALLSIADTGVGIADEHLPHVFDRFYRADAARSRKAGGNGLGLAICKSIVEAHHGTISVTSRLGEGSTFCVRIPLA